MSLVTRNKWLNTPLYIMFFAKGSFIINLFVNLYAILLLEPFFKFLILFGIKYYSFFFFLVAMFFVYLLFQVGILQCVCRNCFKMSCVTCKAYFNAMEEISCFLWYKLRNTKRVYRHRFADLEEGFSSSYSDDSSSESRSTRVYRYNLLCTSGSRLVYRWDTGYVLLSSNPIFIYTF